MGATDGRPSRRRCGPRLLRTRRRGGAGGEGRGGARPERGGRSRDLDSRRGRPRERGRLRRSEERNDPACGEDFREPRRSGRGERLSLPRESEENVAVIAGDEVHRRPVEHRGGSDARQDGSGQERPEPARHSHGDAVTPDGPSGRIRSSREMSGTHRNAIPRRIRVSTPDRSGEVESLCNEHRHLTAVVRAERAVVAAAAACRDALVIELFDPVRDRARASDVEKDSRRRA
jgi:hypothetical protein